MDDHVLLLAPSANRVYAGHADQLAAAELAVLLGSEAPAAEPVRIAGVGYLALPLTELDDRAGAALGAMSASLAVFGRDQGRLTPIEITRPDRFDDDLVSIPKYPGKTNEQFTRLLVNITLASITRTPSGPLSVLDPLCGRGTTLSTGLILGHDVAGVDADLKAIEAYAAYLKTYLRRKRLKHTADLAPVRRDGKSIGRRLDISVTPDGGTPDGGTPDGGTRDAASRPQTLTVFSGDTRQSAALFGKRRFDAVIADAPYGVVHGSQTDVRGVSGRRDRSAAGLIGEALGVWAGQLRTGGALGLSWNSLGLTRERLSEIVVGAGLRPLDSGPYLAFAHRVDSSIHRDVFVAVKD